MLPNPLRCLARTACFCAAALAATAVRPHSAHASGFELREGSADWMANAFAGDTAKAYDASTVWSNPAGMVRLAHNELDASVNGIFPSIGFSGANYVGPGLATPGTTGDNLIQAAATAGIYGVWSLTSDFKLGIGAGAPFGQRVSNPADFVGRYQSLVSSITDEAFTLSAAYRINQHISIGGGPVIDVFNARLTQAINIGPVSALTGAPVVDVHGSDVSAGYNLGALYQVDDSLRFGVDYRSRIRHNIAGTQDVFVPPALAAIAPLAAAQLEFLNTPARTSITLPDSVAIGAYWQVTQQFALLTDLSWTDWSLLKTIDVIPDNPGVPGSSLAEYWRDTYAVSVGANYNVTKELMLQGGFGFDESPVTGQNRTSRVPDSNRYILGVGAQYDILPNLTLQVAYAHVFFASAPVTTQATATSGVLVGQYSSAANTASLGVKYRF